MRKLFILLLTASGIQSQPQGHVLAEARDSQTRIQIRVLPKSMFTIADLEAVARQFLAGSGSAQTSNVLLAYSDRTVASNEAQGCEQNYAQWKLFHDNLSNVSFAAAAVISIHGDAVLLLRAFDGSGARNVLRGNDPTQLRFEGAALDILFVGGRRRTRLEGCGVPGQVDPILYVKTTAVLSEDLCKRITSWLASRMNVKYIWAHFRNDLWFICDAPFPVRYPFSGPEAPPSEVSYGSLPEFTCFISCDGTRICAGPPPRPRR